MSGVAIVGEMLRAHAPLVALVPLDRIKAGALPQGAALPAIGVASVGSNEDRMLDPGPTYRETDRVRVVVLASNYRERATLLGLVRKACANKRGNFAGVTGVSVLPDGRGPDTMPDEAGVWRNNRDFLVSFNETG